jgi:hypothetical protein
MMSSAVSMTKTYAGRRSHVELFLDAFKSPALTTRRKPALLGHRLYQLGCVKIFVELARKCA